VVEHRPERINRRECAPIIAAVPISGRIGVLALGVCFAGAALPVTAGAGTAAVSRTVARHARPGERVSFSAAVGGARTCTVRAGAVHSTTNVTGAARIRVSLRVARRARAGAWRISISCPPLPARNVALNVRRSGQPGSTTRQLVAGTIRVEVTARTAPRRPAVPSSVTAPRAPSATSTPSTAPVPMSEADALARARADWSTYGAGYLAVFRNGQCTDWAAQRRPDIVEGATVRLWADHFMGRPDLGISWDGGFWDDMARAARLPVGSLPRAGAVVTFDPGVMGADLATGHIAYVDSVNGDGTFTVSEMNAPFAWVVTYRTIPTAAIAQGGINFVY
jgi:surface antigen